MRRLDDRQALEGNDTPFVIGVYARPASEAIQDTSAVEGIALGKLLALNWRALGEEPEKAQLEPLIAEIQFLATASELLAISVDCGRALIARLRFPTDGGPTGARSRIRPRSRSGSFRDVLRSTRPPPPRRRRSGRSDRS